jgi:diguanylate cyclase (GGDEF)-like protein
MQLHPRIGFHLVRQIPALEPIAPAILHHHERFDGDGYPGRLRGEAIPIDARIIAVADAFSAMVSDRPYRSARSAEEACAELERCAGEQFDPEVVRLFVAEVRRHSPDERSQEPPTPDPELDVHREPGAYVLGDRSFGITDSLTMLYSVRHFHESAHAEAQRSLVRGQPFGVVTVRLTDLEKINRESGFAAGDAALRSVADAVRTTAGAINGSAFRISGCQLALVARDLDEQATERVAASLRDALRSDSPVAIGTATWRRGEGSEQTIERALRAARGEQADASLSPFAPNREV